MHALAKEVVAEIRQGDTVIEVGSHRGDAAVLMAKRGAHVHAIEPDRANFEVLSRRHSPCYRYAISDHCGPVTFYSLKGSNRCSSLFRKVGKKKKEQPHKESLVGVTLDKFADCYAPGPIALIRFDCYGAEYRIFKGETGCLFRTALVLITMHNKQPFDKYKGARHLITLRLRNAGLVKVQGDSLKSEKHIHQLWRRL